MTSGARRFHVETLGCPKNAVDSDRIVAALLADGLVPADDAESADLVVVNTCAFVEAAREESVETLLALSERRKDGAKLVATGCMAERYGSELADALPEADAVVGFGAADTIAATVGLAAPTPVQLTRKPRGVRDLLDLPRAPATAPWAYLKVAEGCDRACAFCAIPTFRGTQRSLQPDAVVAEASALVAQGVRELVLVAQDLAWYGRDIGSTGALAPLLERLDGLRPDGLARVRLLYLYPSEVRDPLVATMLSTPSVVPYFDLSLQHASRPLLARMKRWGSGAQFAETIDRIRQLRPDATFRSSFITGFPGETEEMHEELCAFLDAVQLDWAGFFPYSQEADTAAATLDGAVEAHVVRERLAELAAIQDPITAAARAALVGEHLEVLVDSVDHDAGLASARSAHEAPEIDGIVLVPAAGFRAGDIVRVCVDDVEGPDLYATAVGSDR